MLDSLLITAALMGWAGGPHCLAMCAAPCAAVAHAGGPKGHALAWFMLGRLLGYSALGALAAAAMQGLGWLTVYSAALRPIWSLFHAFALVLGLWLMWRADLPPWVQAWGRYTWQRILRMAQRLGSAQVGAPLLTGALWAFLPCGLLYSALVVAALAAVVPAHALLWQAEDTTPYECDGLTAYRERPLAVALPETESQVAAVLKACHALGVKTVAVTAGYIHAEPRREFFAKMDAANIDLKAFTDDFYFKLCVGHLQPILDLIAAILSGGRASRLYRAVRSGGRYPRSLELLDRSRRYRPDIATKTGIMVGLGETMTEVLATMDDVREDPRGFAHKAAVRAALAAGKSVPQSVRDEYPDLTDRPQTAPQSPPVAPASPPPATEPGITALVDRLYQPGADYAEKLTQNGTTNN